MELPTDVITEIVTKLPVEDMLPYSHYLSRVNILKIAYADDLPVPYPGISIREQVADLISSSKLSVNKRMKIAITRGDAEIVKRMIELGANRDEAMSSAARGGHMEIVELMLTLGADDYDWAMSSAAEGGHLKIVKLMLTRNADDYNTAMSSAAGGGHMEVVELMLSLNADNYNRAMVSAALGGRMEIVKLMLSRMIPPELHTSGSMHPPTSRGAKNYDLAIQEAEHEGHQEIVDLLRTYLS